MTANGHREPPEPELEQWDHPGLEAERESFLLSVVTELVSVPLVLGFAHPAEAILARWLDGPRGELVCEWLLDYCRGGERPAVAADIVVCLGNLPKPGTAQWRAALIAAALRSDHLGLRDAAVLAAELWDEATLLPALEAHDEPAEYLREYIRAVIGYLRETK